MKRIVCLMLCSVLITGLMAACSSGGVSSAPSTPVTSEEENLTVELDDDEAPVGEESGPESAPASKPEEPAEQEPDNLEPNEQEPETDADDAPALDLDVNEVYEALAEAAGLTAVLEMTMLDLNAGGGITTDNIEGMAAGQSKVGGDSGLVIVLQVASGTQNDMLAELEAYRDSLIGGPAYDEFADAKAATENARIVTHGNLVVYVAVSADSGASYDDVDAALAALFE